MFRRIVNNYSARRSDAAMRVRFGESGSCPVDQSPSQDFNIDPDTGRPMEVITQLIRTQNAVQQQALFAGLEEFKSNFLPDGTLDEDALMFSQPRLAQLPSELADLSVKYAAFRAKQAELKKEADLKAARDAEERELLAKWKASFEKDVVKPVNS